MFADMHIHSTKSDGTMSYDELIERLNKKNVSLFSITDHNIIPDIDYLKNLSTKHKMQYVPGVEIDTKFENYILHVLAYNFKVTDELKKITEKSHCELLKMSVDLINLMSNDYDEISAAEYENFDYNVKLGGWKGIHYLSEKGVSTDIYDAMRFYSKYDCDYIKYDFPPIDETCKAINSSGGIAILAHPSNWFSNLSKAELYTILDRLKACGINGIECYYPSNSPELTKWCLDYCEANNLFITAGCDCHGEFMKIHNGILYDIASVEVDKAKIKINSPI